MEVIERHEKPVVSKRAGAEEEVVIRKEAGSAQKRFGTPSARPKWTSKGRATRTGTHKAGRLGIGNILPAASSLAALHYFSVPKVSTMFRRSRKRRS